MQNMTRQRRKKKKTQKEKRECTPKKDKKGPYEKPRESQDNGKEWHSTPRERNRGGTDHRSETSQRWSRDEDKVSKEMEMTCVSNRKRMLLMGEVILTPKEREDEEDEESKN